MNTRTIADDTAGLWATVHDWDSGEVDWGNPRMVGVTPDLTKIIQHAARSLPEDRSAASLDPVPDEWCDVFLSMYRHAIIVELDDGTKFPVMALRWTVRKGPESSDPERGQQCFIHIWAGHTIPDVHHDFTEAQFAEATASFEVRIIPFIFHMVADSWIRQVRPSRASRRRTQRATGGEPQDILVVSLRRERHDRDDEEGPGVDWSHRWLVSGHWREYEPGKITWVRPHVKGPDDKPFVMKDRRFVLHR